MNVRCIRYLCSMFYGVLVLACGQALLERPVSLEGGIQS